MSVTLVLEDELDISRGDLIASAHNVAEVTRQFDASVVWLNESALDTTRTYLLKHTSQTMPAEVKAVRHRVDVTSLDQLPAEKLELNEIGGMRIETSRPIYFDPYTRNRATGSFVLIDPETNSTVAAGMIVAAVARERGRLQRETVALTAHRVTPAERIGRYRHSGTVVAVGARTELAWTLERKLFDRGCAVTVADHAADETIDALEKAGLLVLLVSDGAPDLELSEDDAAAADQMITRLEETGVLLPEEALTGGEGI